MQAKRPFSVALAPVNQHRSLRLDEPGAHCIEFRSTETAYGGVELRPTTKQQRPGLVAGTLNPLRRYSIETAG